jgi:hypothetical protein
MTQENSRSVKPPGSAVSSTQHPISSHSESAFKIEQRAIHHDWAAAIRDIVPHLLEARWTRQSF